MGHQFDLKFIVYCMIFQSQKRLAIGNAFHLALSQMIHWLITLKPGRFTKIYH